MYNRPIVIPLGGRLVLSRLFRQLLSPGRSARGERCGEIADPHAMRANRLFAEATRAKEAGGADAARRLAREALALDPSLDGPRELLIALELRGAHYLEVLAGLHALLRPAAYLEIGVATGKSLLLVRPGTLGIGVDPSPQVAPELPPNLRLIRRTSDEFFRDCDLESELEGRPLELAFIDGMHRCEFALRDFINLEARCAAGAAIAIHDCYPIDALSAQRDRKSVFWTGDVWRTVVALRRYRPDLEVRTLACPRSGLGLVRRLDPSSRILRERYDEVVGTMLAYDFASFEPRKNEELNLVPGNWVDVAARFTRSATPPPD